MGKSTLTTLVSNNFSGYNSIRYRGYYYDTETGFYFLNSRYYSPEWRRFIQPAGASSLNPDSVNGLNLYCYANNNPVGVAYSGFSSDVATSGMANSIGNNFGRINSGYQGIISNSSNILSALGALSSAFGFFDQWSGYLNGGLEAGLNYWGPKGVGFHFLGQYSNALSKFGKGMAVVGAVLSWGSGVYNNFSNPNYTIGEAYAASALDAAYYTGKGYGSYWLGSKVGQLSVSAGIAAGSAALGATVFGTTIGFVGAFAIGGGVAVIVGIAGAVVLYHLGQGVDWLYEKIKEGIFE